MSEQTVNKETDLARWDECACLLRTIAHPVRLMILESLRNGPRCVIDINTLIAIPQPHLSQHIAALRKAKLIACYTNGPLRCYYILKPTFVRQLNRLLSAEHPERVRNRRTVIRESLRRRENYGGKPGSVNRTRG